MSRFSPFDSGLSGQSLSTKVERLAETVDQLAEFLPYLPALLKSVKEPRDPGINIFPAWITGCYAADSQSNRWLYSWIEVLVNGQAPSGDQRGHDQSTIQRNSFSRTADPYALPARNTLEFDNRGGNAEFDGVGVKVGDIFGPGGTELVATSQLLPIGNYNFGGGDIISERRQMVMMMEFPNEIFGSRHWFSASNAVRVECSA